MARKTVQDVVEALLDTRAKGGAAVVCYAPEYLITEALRAALAEHHCLLRHHWALPPEHVWFLAELPEDYLEKNFPLPSVFF